MAQDGNIQLPNRRRRKMNLCVQWLHRWQNVHHLKTLHWCLCRYRVGVCHTNASSFVLFQFFRSFICCWFFFGIVNSDKECHVPEHTHIHYYYLAIDNCLFRLFFGKTSNEYCREKKNRGGRREKNRKIKTEQILVFVGAKWKARILMHLPATNNE